MPELRTARENARLEIGSQRGRNSHQIGVLGIYDLRGLSCGRTELLVDDMRLLAPRDEINPQQRDGPREATFCTLHVNLRRLCPDTHG